MPPISEGHRRRFAGPPQVETRLQVDGPARPGGFICSHLLFGDVHPDVQTAVQGRLTTDGTDEVGQDLPGHIGGRNRDRVAVRDAEIFHRCPIGRCLTITLDHQWLSVATQEDGPMPTVQDCPVRHVRPCPDGMHVSMLTTLVLQKDTHLVVNL